MEIPRTRDFLSVRQSRPFRSNFSRLYIPNSPRPVFFTWTKKALWAGESLFPFLSLRCKISTTFCLHESSDYRPPSLTRAVGGWVWSVTSSSFPHPWRRHRLTKQQVSLTCRLPPPITPPGLKLCFFGRRRRQLGAVGGDQRDFIVVRRRSRSRDRETLKSFLSGPSFFLHPTLFLFSISSVLPPPPDYRRRHSPFLYLFPRSLRRRRRRLLPRKQSRQKESPSKNRTLCQ